MKGRSNMDKMVLKSCRIYYNYDYEGEIIISNEKSSLTPVKKPIGERAEVSFTVVKMVDLYEHYKTAPKVNKIAIIGLCGNKITILRKDLEEFIINRLVYKIGEKIDSKKVDNKTVFEIANLLKIK